MIRKRKKSNKPNLKKNTKQERKVVFASLKFPPQKSGFLSATNRSSKKETFGRSNSLDNHSAEFTAYEEDFKNINVETGQNQTD